MVQQVVGNHCQQAPPIEGYHHTLGVLTSRSQWEVVALAQLGISHNHFTHSHFMQSKEVPWLEVCWEPLTVHHIFTVGERFWELCYHLGASHDLHSTLRDDPKAVERILFIHERGWPL